jgi:hypothetical protein
MSCTENMCHTQCEMKSHWHHNDITQAIQIIFKKIGRLPFVFHFGTRLFTIAICSCIAHMFMCTMFLNRFMFWKNYWMWQHELGWVMGSSRNTCNWHWMWLQTIPTPSTQTSFFMGAITLVLYRLHWCKRLFSL